MRVPSPKDARQRAAWLLTCSIAVALIGAPAVVTAAPREGSNAKKVRTTTTTSSTTTTTAVATTTTTTTTSTTSSTTTSSTTAPTGTTIPGTLAPTGPSGTWTLAFADEFNDTSLDTIKWVPCYPWNKGGCTNGGNNELQWYLPENVSESNGSLHMTAIPKTVSGGGKLYNYTSGMISTGNDYSTGKPAGFTFTYGYMEARVKVPKGQGLWPAVWMLPIDGSWPPEIDAMEILGHDTDTVYMTNHWAVDGVHQQNSASYSGPDFAAEYHTFGFDWQPDHITWYVDGVVSRTSFNDSSKIPNKPMYVLLNLAVGGNWPGSPDAATPFPSTLSVDWVRVWKSA